jgi:hypothetical protein
MLKIIKIIFIEFLLICITIYYELERLFLFFQNIGQPILYRFQFENHELDCIYMKFNMNGFSERNKTEIKAIVFFLLISPDLYINKPDDRISTVGKLFIKKNSISISSKYHSSDKAFQKDTTSFLYKFYHFIFLTSTALQGSNNQRI